MFLCYYCKQISKPQEKETKVVIETRHKIYWERNSHGGKHVMGEGDEIVREVKVCPRCVGTTQTIERSLS